MNLNEPPASLGLPTQQGTAEPEAAGDAQAPGQGSAIGQRPVAGPGISVDQDSAVGQGAATGPKPSPEHPSQPEQDPLPDEAESAWTRWLDTPSARYVLAWEQAEFDHAVSDVFGYYALQCGLPRLETLRENRMSLRLRACAWEQDDCDHPGAAPRVADLWIDRYDALPFADQSLDLVALPHILEFADDPHRVLREVDRVLRPEGRVVVSGFNPASLWGARQLMGRAVGRPFLPQELQFIGLPRLRDWFKLLGLEMDRGRFGCYRPAVTGERWLERTRFMEHAGDRWWPICGAVYFVCAIKRVAGMRMVGPRVRRRLPRAPVIVVAPNRVSDRPRLAESDASPLGRNEIAQSRRSR